MISIIDLKVKILNILKKLLFEYSISPIIALEYEVNRVRPIFKYFLFVEKSKKTIKYVDVIRCQIYILMLGEKIDEKD